ncbi:M20/M25/M40 family metallo-hydrolase [Luteithermobacter gelatinilyticus]|uniref:M20/M25/M40 family metallo-hydrolase n=1 Tax=Luteithermobacter gelatinilyticus TaxID=2582913 RepID=UPI00143D430E|nr:M20/M25/M40 family metallo-hydrolase [Luteithermobacter gelatinilyticus]
MTALVLVLMLAGLRILTEGPPPKPASLPAGHFSADRAYDLLGELLEGIGAHPAGSAPNKLLRERLVKKLSALGLSPELQQDFHCAPLAPGCSYLENVIAILPGSNPSRKALMATAHYDSAPAAGGAADDGAGIAALLEIITNLKASDPLENDVIFLFSDAEESGLRGAMAFNKKHPLMDRVGMILNMEARGVSGPSLMFETGPRNYRQVQGFANSTPRPVSTSLLVEIYKRMPNGTDLMAYAERGLPALNFAFSRGVSLYHSPHDTIENLSKSSLQHHGDNMLAAIRHFGNTDLESLHSDSDATYIDFFGYFLIMWPAHLSIWIAGAALAGLIFVAIRQKPAPIKILWPCSR